MGRGHTSVVFALVESWMKRLFGSYRLEVLVDSCRHFTFKMYPNLTYLYWKCSASYHPSLLDLQLMRCVVSLCCFLITIYYSISELIEQKNLAHIITFIFFSFFFFLKKS